MDDYQKGSFSRTPSPTSSDTPPVSGTTGATPAANSSSVVTGTASSVLVSPVLTVVESAVPVSNRFAVLQEESDDDTDHEGIVDFDLLDMPLVMDTNASVSAYSDSAPPNHYVVLADNQKSPCLGVGSIKVNMGGFTIVLHDVLHVPALRSPLYSVRCHRRSTGCSFIADNDGAFLSFPTFFITVDDSVDCVITGKVASPDAIISFDNRLAGKVSNVTDNTCHCSKRRPPVASVPSVPLENCQHGRGVDINSPSISSPIVVEDVTDEENIAIPNGYAGPVVEMFLPEESTSSIPESVSLDPTSLLMRELGVTGSDISGSKLSPLQIKQIADACIKDLTEKGCITSCSPTYQDSNFGYFRRSS